MLYNQTSFETVNSLGVTRTYPTAGGAAPSVIISSFRETSLDVVDIDENGGNYSTTINLL